VIAEGTMDVMLASEHPWLKSYFRGKRSRAELRPARSAHHI
jgi:phospholipid/cholesterol/gamma-HCH transport system ATP-binding protein